MSNPVFLWVIGTAVTSMVSRQYLLTGQTWVLICAVLSAFVPLNAITTLLGLGGESMEVALACAALLWIALYLVRKRVR